MASEVKIAPKEVIDALDNWQEITDTQFVYSLIDDMEYDEFNQFGLKVVRKWIYPDKNQDIWLERELAVINHVFNDERLQPERETLYYVEIIDDDDIGSKTLVVKGRVRPVNVIGTSDYVPDYYEDGINHETAVKAQALYGGTIEEIK